MKKIFKRLSVLVAAMALITTALLGGTLAKYTTTWDGTDSIEVASWAVSVGGTAASATEKTFTLALTPDSKTEVAEGKIAPGIGGSFAVELANTGEVDAKISGSFKVSNAPQNLVFKIGETALTGTAGSGDDAGKTIYTIPEANEITLAQSSGSATLTVNWEWAYEGDTNEEDTADGISASDMTVALTLTATQVEPKTARTAEAG